MCLRALRGAVSVSLPPLFTIFMCIKLSNECTRCLGAAALAGSGAGRRRARLRRAGPRTANRAFRGACGSAVGGLSRPEVGLDAAPSGRARRPAPPDGGGYPPRPLPRSGAAAEPPIRNSQHMVRWRPQRDDQNDLGGQGETTSRGATWCTPQAYFRGGKEAGNEGPRHEKCVLGMQSVQSG